MSSEGAKVFYHRERRSDLVIVIGLLAIGMGIIFWRAIFLGEVIVPGDIPYTTPIWWGTAPNEHYYTAQNYLLPDQINEFYIWHHLAAQSMQTTGKIPLWNPYIFTGQPLVADSQSALFYPPNLLLFWFSPGHVATMRACFNLFVAGLFTFLCCRQFGISRIGGILAALGFSFSGPVIVWLGHPHANTFVWLPFLLWAGENLLTRQRIIVWGGVTSVGVALAMLGGHPQTTFHVLAVFTAYMGFRILWSRKELSHWKQRGLVLILALVIGFLISSIQVLPFIDFMLQSSTYAQGGRGVGRGLQIYSNEWLPNLTTLVTLIYPNFFGNPVARNYFWPFSTPQNYSEQAMYFGLIPLMLALSALLMPKKSRPVLIIAVLALFCLGIALRLPGFELINHLPVFAMASNGRLKNCFVLLGAILGGFGYDAFKQSVASDRKASPQVVYGVLLPPLLVMAVFVVIAILKNFIMLQGTGSLPVTFKNYLLFNIFAWDRGKTMISAGIASIILIGYFLLRKRHIAFAVFEYGLIALTIIELVVLAWRYNPTIKDKDILPSAPILEVLKQDKQPFRIIESGEIFLPNYHIVHQIAHLGGHDLPVFRRYADLYRAQGTEKDFAHSWRPEWPLSSVLNAKYFLATKTPAPEGFRLIYDRLNVRMYENQNVLPRAYMVYQTEVIADAAAILRRMLDGTFDFKNRVILEQPLAPQIMAELAKQPAGTPQCQVNIGHYGTDEVAIEVLTEKPGILVMSDLFAPGWEAFVDSQPVELYRANYTFRAVFVPSGKHTVRFAYKPVAFRIGAICSLCGLVLVVVGCGVFGRKRKDNHVSPFY